MLDVVVRYFPHDIDPDGNINALWTPEFNGINPPEWNEHFLSSVAWWNVYQTCENNDPPIPSDPYDCTNVGGTALHEQDARQGDAILLRFNRDSDRDGYQDRVEMHYYCTLPDTDPDTMYCADAHLRPEIHPQPEVTAAATATRVGDEATVLLKIANTGNFDIYGVDAVLYAPDDTVTIGNNTVGGNGLVHPGQQVAVGSLVLMDDEDLVDWQFSTGNPYATGNYVGASDAAYTFTVDIAGVVGSDPAAMTWTNNAGITGTLDLGSNYHAPLPVEVNDGVLVGFNTGTLVTGESFSLSALTPRDTFSYTIKSEPYTEPVIVVSYSDPQGSYKFVTPITVTNLISDITPYAGQMLKDVRLDILTHGPVLASETQTTTLTINSPHPEPIVDGHVYLNFVADGELVLELPYTMTIQPGPSVIPISWSTDQFSQTYDSAADNILIAFWTDAQDNIIDSAARPFNTFLNDPPPVAKTSSLTWDFGTVIQGQIATTEIAVGNNGLLNIFAAIETSAPGISMIPVSSTRIDPASFQTLKLSLDSAELPVGPYSDSITIRTNDIANPEVVINVTGTIEPIAGDAFAYTGDVYRPWDQTVFISGTFSVNEPVTFTHAISDAPEQMHPLYVYSEDGVILRGVGEFGHDFQGDVASFGIFGDGGDGDLIVGSGETVYIDTQIDISGTVDAGMMIVPVANANGFSIGDEILVIQMQGIGAGNYEFQTIEQINGNQLVLRNALENTYVSPGITLYAGGGYSGVSQRYISDICCFWDELIGDNTVSSIQVPSGMKAILFREGYYKDQYSIFTSDDPDLSNDTVGDNNTSSMLAGGNIAQVVKVHQFQDVTIETGGTLRVGAYGGKAGIIIFRATGTVTVEEGGTIGTPGLGYPRGIGRQFGSRAFQGQSINTIGTESNSNNYGGGGGGDGIDGSGCCADGGGGGGYATPGENGEVRNGGTSGQGGTTYGVADLSLLYLGSSGGGGGADGNKPDQMHGGWGGGIVYISANEFMLLGRIDASGGDGLGYGHNDDGAQIGGGGGGAGGSVFLVAANVDIGSSRVDVSGGAGGVTPQGGRGGNGGVGRIRIEYCDLLVGSTNPLPSVEQITCFIVRQLQTDPTTNELNLPEDIDGHTRYQIQYGQRGEFVSTNPFTGTQVYTDTYSLTLPKRNYTDFTMDALFENLASSTYTFTLDIGADGSVDWSGSGTEQPLITGSPDLSTALNTYLSSTADAYGADVTIPISMTLDTTGDVFLTNVVAVAGGDSDPQVDTGDLTVSNATPTETDTVTATTIVHNAGVYTATNVIVSLFAGDPVSDGIYLGSDFVPTIAPAGSATAETSWNTTGYTGTVELFAVLDIAGQLEEQDEDNNTTSVTVTVQTRPDLSVMAVTLDGSARQDMPVDVLVTIGNSGQTDAGIQVVSLYDGDPAVDGSLIGSSDIAVMAGLTATVPISWTPTQLGATTLYAIADSGDVVPESNEENNQETADIYVGWGAPVAIDAGAAGDVAYDPATGYGYLTTGATVSSCGTEPYQTYREMGSGEQLQYRFDHLLPDRFYHLDLSFFLCSGSRNLEITVDGGVTTTVTASNSDLERVSILLDPASYTDNSITVTIEKISGGLGGPVVSELTLTDIRYCYRDSAPVETACADAVDGCGWLPGSSGDDSWGNLPYETVRFANSDPVSYQFDGLDPANYYEIDLTFYEDAMDGSGRTQDTTIDGTTVLAGLTLSSTVQYLTVDVPGEAYETDQSIQVDITDVVVSQPVISEIAVEEKTLLPELLTDRVQAAVIQGGSAVGSRVYVIDEDGLAVAEADVAIEWTLPDSSTVTDTFQPIRLAAPNSWHPMPAQAHTRLPYKR